MIDPNNLPFHQHVMFLHSNGEYKVATDYVNEAVRNGLLTVYVPGNTNNESHLPGSPSEDTEYEEGVDQGNLLTLDGRSFYKFALAGNMEPFEEVKLMLEEAIKERVAFKKNDEVIIVDDVAAELAGNQKFEECLNLEKWWREIHSEWLQKGLKVTVICPHPSPIFDNRDFTHYKQAISSLHNIIMAPRLS
jgi:hypothetical protein